MPEIFDITFKKNTTATWLIPGYHTRWTKAIKQTVQTSDGKKAIISHVELQVQWKQLSPTEKRWLRRKYGLNVQYKYHQYTRLTLAHLLPQQLTFPGIDWSEPAFDPQW